MQSDDSLNPVMFLGKEVTITIITITTIFISPNGQFKRFKIDRQFKVCEYLYFSNSALWVVNSLSTLSAYQTLILLVVHLFIGFWQKDQAWLIFLVWGDKGWMCIRLSPGCRENRVTTSIHCRTWQSHRSRAIFSQRPSSQVKVLSASLFVKIEILQNSIHYHLYWWGITVSVG